MKAKVYRFPNRLLSPDKGWVLRCEFRSPNLGDGIFVANNRALIDTGASHCAISFKIWREITDTFSGVFQTQLTNKTQIQKVYR